VFTLLQLFMLGLRSIGQSRENRRQVLISYRAVHPMCDH